MFIDAWLLMRGGAFGKVLTSALQAKLHDCLELSKIWSSPNARTFFSCASANFGANTPGAVDTSEHVDKTHGPASAMVNEIQDNELWSSFDAQKKHQQEPICRCTSLPFSMASGRHDKKPAHGLVPKCLTPGIKFGPPAR
jgi:hypothetical protein